METCDPAYIICIYTMDPWIKYTRKNNQHHEKNIPWSNEKPSSTYTRYKETVTKMYY